MNLRDLRTELHSGARKRTSPQILLLRRQMRTDIKIKDIYRQPHRRTRIGNIHNTRHVSLHRRTRQQQVDLVIAVP